jgi:hypothetical protein
LQDDNLFDVHGSRNEELADALSLPKDEEHGEGGYMLLRDDNHSPAPTPALAEFRAMLSAVQGQLQQKEEKLQRMQDQARDQAQRIEEAQCQRAAMQEELRHENDARAAMQEQLDLHGRKAASAAAVANHAEPTRPSGGARLCTAAAAVATVPDRVFFDTHQSADVRAADPKALVGRTIEVDGSLGTVKAMVVKAGGSTLHTVEFGSGEVRNIHLTKQAGGKGTKFHIAASDDN